jgi:predicted phosphoribosyltransferase
MLKLSQFADDTLLFLSGYAGLKQAWKLIDSLDSPLRSLHVKKLGPPGSPQGAKK